MVFILAAATEGLTFILIYLFLPDYPRKEAAKGHPSDYISAVRSIWRIAFHEPMMVQNWPLALISCLLASAFWSNTTFILAASPFDFSTLRIGLVALSGIAGALTSPLSGLMTDKLLHWVRIFLKKSDSADRFALDLRHPSF